MTFVSAGPPSKGIYFHGSGNLQVSLPLHLSVGPVLLESLHLGFDIKEEGFAVEASTSGALSIGPLTVTVERLGLLVNASLGSGNLGLFDLSPRFKPPNGVGLVDRRIGRRRRRLPALRSAEGRIQRHPATRDCREDLGQSDRVADHADAGRRQGLLVGGHHLRRRLCADPTRALALP